MKSSSYLKVRRVFFLSLALFVLFCGFGIAAGATGGDSGSGVMDIGPGMAYLGAALSTGIAAIGGGIAVGGGAPAAIGALTEDPSSFGKALIFVALGEGIALYGMLISILILNKVP